MYHTLKKRLTKSNKKSTTLKNNNNSINNKFIIHISGSSGVGKTTLGNKLQKKFGNKIIVKDTDDLINEFSNGNYENFDAIKYQKFINNFINKQNVPIIFVGLNNGGWGLNNKPYNMYSKYNFYITLDKNIIFVQRCKRFLQKYALSNEKIFYNDLIKNPKIFNSKIKDACNYNFIMNQINQWDNYHKKHKFLFIPREQIFTKVSKILNNYL